MIRGETVTVLAPIAAGEDDLGNAVLEWEQSEVRDVLVAPGASADAIASTRPDGVTVEYTLHFPKTFAGALRGCDVIVRGKRCRVVGSPDRYTESNCPTRWNMSCEVKRVEG